jgi:hypothetical protein
VCPGHGSRHDALSWSDAALDGPLFEAVTRQLEAKGVAVRTGILVDAALIASASIRHDGEALGGASHP